MVDPTIFCCGELIFARSIASPGGAGSGGRDQDHDKEDWLSPFADRTVFILAPAIAMVALITAFAVVPVSAAIGAVDQSSWSKP